MQGKRLEADEGVVAEPVADASCFANAELAFEECTAMQTLRVAVTALICALALVPATQLSEQISYRLEAPNGGLSTTGPTDPNAPSS